ncbi:structural maintenance of chromosomes protein 2-like [Strongylocentrotus purpuratus]|uniref:Structural maintenance of chromosomes protein n=1 Tax=Strongylocentrotus purpuratus TaxID=7668 RepID=A0A7M7PLT7_STRPU|nr:structural maintenance of chromosomes protein 2-like [Strongylocentrotus purpuratus]
MYIKEIIVDGFKSYAQRTEIKGFDPLFNAITGLNGSGKSNILDSICFLLGISNLSQVRAGSLQELVYKGGQAGVTKATVTIVFDNKDKKQSPVGYDSFDEFTVSRQVVIGGRNKYLINGSNANNSRVQDLFCSVQLNVNNPHFLIMQGRITKVLNMKPPEILSMIEEAAGTRMYENKKASAQKTIEKKDAKLKEIESVLNEEITPTLTRLNEERSSYLEYQKVLRELDHLTKLHVAYQFVSAEKLSKESEQELGKIAEATTAMRQRMKEIDDKLLELTNTIQALEKERDEEAGGVLKEIEKRLVEAQNSDTKIQSSLQHKKEAVTNEKKNKKAVEKSYTEDQATLKAKEKEIEKLTGSFTKLEEKCKENQEGVAQAQKHLQAVSAGLSSNEDGEDKTLADQLMTCKAEMKAAETNLKQAQSTLKSDQAELKKKEAELKKTAKEYEKDKANMETVLKSKTKLEDEMKKLGFEDGKEDDLENQHKTLSAKVDNLSDKVNALTSRFPNLQFEYKDPEKNFDRSKVHGLVARLLKVKDVKYATSLEVTAGRKLYNVVVDTEHTGKKLLQKGELKRRFTIIPLNKIAARSISGDTVRAAQNLVGKDNVRTALTLVGYEKDVQSAMEFVFGSSLVCNDTAHAKKVTFDPKVRTRTVTLAGDTFDPSGTLTGGARNNSSSVLRKLSELQEAEEALFVEQEKLNAVKKELTKIKGSADKMRALKDQYDLKVHEAQLLEERLKQGTHHSKLEEINALKASVEEQDKMIGDAKTKQKETTERTKNLEEKIKDASAVRERELKTAEQEVTKSKKKAEETNKQMKQKQQEMNSLKFEVDNLKQELTKYDDQLTASDQAIEAIQAQQEEMEQQAKESKVKVKETKKELDGQKEKLKEKNQDIQTKISEREALKKEDQDTQLQIKEQEHVANKITRDSADAVHRVENLMTKYEWIASERQFFGQPNTAYDFSSSDPRENGRRLQKLQETKEKLGKSVNMRAMNMLSKAEEKYNELMKKKRIVENDKQKIMDTIKELDEKKNEALKKAWQQVNKDFGSIFSTLLPGTSAKLTPPEGKGILDGLEVKVAFGDVWKESLQELSGGQRSLVALSLILSLLLFKPAPLYILDEVDAALDLSHTQNIGQMLRTHFKHSQFIVVSLKDGMFNNANVLYKTKFVDGVSTVTRYAQQQSSLPPSVPASFARGKSTTTKKTSAKRARTEPLTEKTN